MIWVPLRTSPFASSRDARIVPRSHLSPQARMRKRDGADENRAAKRHEVAVFTTRTVDPNAGGVGVLRRRPMFGYDRRSHDACLPIAVTATVRYSG